MNPDQAAKKDNVNVSTCENIIINPWAVDYKASRVIGVCVKSFVVSVHELRRSSHD